MGKLLLALLLGLSKLVSAGQDRNASGSDVTNEHMSDRNASASSVTSWGVSDRNASASSVTSWEVSDEVVGGDAWCSASVPEPSWGLACTGGGLRVKVLTYNLFWWNLFDLREGDGQRSGRLISASGWPEPYDVMGFQECDSITRVIGDAGLQLQYEMIQGPHALGMAYRKAVWKELGRGENDVAEDRDDQWYGTRAVHWVRLEHNERGNTLFFVNHHGPLPISTGGKCGGEAAAYNIMKVIGENMAPGDDVILVGDFNAVTESDTIQKLGERMHRLFSGSAHGGVDHIFSSCESTVGVWNHGSGGSDHDALCTIVEA